MEVTVLKFKARAKETLRINKHAGSTIRGSLGNGLYNYFCKNKNEDCENCHIKETCVYFELFNPIITQSEFERFNNYSKRFKKKPRGYIIQAIKPLGEKLIYKRGEEFEFKINLVGNAKECYPFLLKAFEESKGIGPKNCQFEIVEVWEEGLEGSQKIYSLNKFNLPSKTITLKEMKEKAKEYLRFRDKIKIIFKTPTHITINSEFVQKLDFYKIMRATFRRISMLSLFYNEEKINVDAKFDKYLEDSKEVKATTTKLDYDEWNRYSNRQDKEIKMKGMTGEIHFELKEEIEKYLPYLLMLEHINLGNDTVFGLGNVEIK